MDVQSLKTNRTIKFIMLGLVILVFIILMYEFLKPTPSIKPKKIIVKTSRTKVINARAASNAANLKMLKHIQAQLNNRVAARNKELTSNYKKLTYVKKQGVGHYVRHKLKLPSLATPMIVPYMITKSNNTVSNLHQVANNKISSKQKVPLSSIIPLGTSAYMRLITKIYSYNSNVPVKAEFTSNVTSREGKVIIPSGSTAVGVAQASNNNNGRVSVNFNDVIYPNGATYPINLTATGLNGAEGISGYVHYHYAAQVLEGIGQTLLGIGSLVVGSGSAMNSSAPYSLQSQIRSNVATNELQNAQNGLNNAQNNTTSNILITVKKGKLFKVIFLSPFKKPA